ncbi:MAG: hypothetical protein FWH36_03045 [Lentimicrobiaceae bacterium]|nr:hypothetical protein [Lentimicrobiaceae bacterium]
MKKIFVAVGIIFCCTAIYARTCTVERNVSGGKIIKNGDDEGQLGYASVSTKTVVTDNSTTSTTNCSGRGNNTCPPSPSCSSLPEDSYGVIIGRLQSYIDLGETAGEFEVEGFVCTWSDGEKSEDEDEEGEIIYSYRLTVTWEIPETDPVDMTITVSPNPVQSHIFVLFSMPIDAIMNVQIKDVTGNSYFNSDVYVSGDDLSIDASVLPTTSGTYYIVCTNSDYTAYATFLK